MKQHERFVKYIMFSCASFSVLGIILIFLFIFKESLPAITQAGLRNLFSTNWNPDQGHYGFLAFLNGTVMTTLGGLLLGAPLGIGTAIFLDQIAPPRMGDVIRRGWRCWRAFPR